jgi:hypothetical protein
VPFGALIPEEVDGMLAAEKNIAVSRLANGATRLQPITLLTGEAAGALAAMSIQQDIPPRQVDWTQLQVVLLKAGSILTSPPMTDMPQGTLLWQAAQLAVTHEWMETEKDGKCHPEAKMTRADATELLSTAYELARTVGTFGPVPTRLASSFVDVPLYSKMSAPAEALKEAGVAPFCNGDDTHFCGTDPMTRGEFVRMVQLLEVKKHPGVTEAMLYGKMRTEKNETISRGEAATVLYLAVESRATVSR